MPVPNSMSDLSNVAGDNYPVGSEPIGNNLDNYLRAHASLIRQPYSLASQSMASGSTVSVANANGESVLITGNATINSLGAGFVGCKRELRFSGTPTLNHSSSLQLPGAQNISVTAGMVLRFRCIANNTWVYTGGTYTPPMSADNITSGTLAVARGGTGLDSYAGNAFLQANGSGTGFIQRSPSAMRGIIDAASLEENTFSGAQVIRANDQDARLFLARNESGTIQGALQVTTAAAYLWANGSPVRVRPNGLNNSAGQFEISTDGTVSVSGSVTASGGFQFSGGPRVPRIFVQSGTPAGASNGDLWIW